MLLLTKCHVIVKKGKLNQAKSFTRKKILFDLFLIYEFKRFAFLFLALASISNPFNLWRDTTSVFP